MKSPAIIFAMLLFFAAQPIDAQTKKTPVAYSAISATQAGFYLTNEMGIFDKNGLSVDPVYVAGGTRIAQALIAGEFPVALAGGAIVNANLAGGDIVFVGGVVNVPSFYVYVHPSIKKPEDLKGKALGITTYGSSTDFTLRYLLRKWGLEPDRDVKVIQSGGQPEILAAMQAGAIQGGNLSSPGDYKAKKLGFTLLADFKNVGLDYPTVSLVSTKSYVKKDPATVKRFIAAYSEGVHRLFTDKELGMKIIGKYTRTQEREVLESSYAYATNFIEKTPRLPVKGIETILDQLGATNPKAKQHKAEDFIDASFYNELDKNGFFKNLWR
ncbi:MAG TPA: ABC transporter substrate-binding protein [Verrucomicrobiae bacterium]|jgi:NitT/TauT family transport system substrate-binding protein|nr:ABC transporter substrate-binding protein [Verrucomicrobiae bacterium]